MRLSAVYLCAFLAVASIGCGGSSAASASGVTFTTGRLTLDDGTSPYAGVLVVEPQTNAGAVTDEDGFFELGELPATQTSLLLFPHNGKEGLELLVDLSGGGAVDLEVSCKQWAGDHYLEWYRTRGCGRQGDPCCSRAHAPLVPAECSALTAVALSADPDSDPTPVVASKDDLPPYSTTLQNGDFEISVLPPLGGVPPTVEVGDGRDDTTEWTFDFTGDPDYKSFKFGKQLTCALLMLTLSTDGALVVDDEITVGALPPFTPDAMQDLPQESVVTLCVDLLDHLSSEAILGQLHDGMLDMRYRDDAIIRKATLKLSVAPVLHAYASSDDPDSDPTAVDASKDDLPPYSTTLQNGDFTISVLAPLGGVPPTVEVGDGRDDTTEWTFDFGESGSVKKFDPTTDLECALLVLRLRTDGARVTDDEITVGELDPFTPTAITTLPQESVVTVCIDLLEGYTSAEILSQLKDGELRMRYRDDAIVREASLKLCASACRKRRGHPKHWGIDPDDLHGAVCVERCTDGAQELAFKIVNLQPGREVEIFVKRHLPEPAQRKPVVILPESLGCVTADGDGCAQLVLTSDFPFDVEDVWLLRRYCVEVRDCDTKELLLLGRIPNAPLPRRQGHGQD